MWWVMADPDPQPYAPTRYVCGPKKFFGRLRRENSTDLGSGPGPQPKSTLYQADTKLDNEIRLIFRMKPLKKVLHFMGSGPCVAS